MICRFIHFSVLLDEDGCGYVEYEIEEDDGEFLWCDRCFEYPIQEGDDATSVSDEEFEYLLSSMF